MKLSQVLLSMAVMTALLLFLGFVLVRHVVDDSASLKLLALVGLPVGAYLWRVVSQLRGAPPRRAAGASALATIIGASIASVGGALELGFLSLLVGFLGCFYVWVWLRLPQVLGNQSAT
jgi:hypothetical protein